LPIRATSTIENPAAGSDYLCGRVKGIDAAARLGAAGPSMASGISQRQISNLVKGTQSAALDTAEAIAQAFDMKTWHMLIRTTGLPPKNLAPHSLHHAVIPKVDCSPRPSAISPAAAA
jgi:hypothetical protein